VAKTAKKGLGRGLNSLLSANKGEAFPQEGERAPQRKVEHMSEPSVKDKQIPTPERTTERSTGQKGEQAAGQKGEQVAGRKTEQTAGRKIEHQPVKANERRAVVFDDDTTQDSSDSKGEGKEGINNSTKEKSEPVSKARNEQTYQKQPLKEESSPSQIKTPHTKSKPQKPEQKPFSSLKDDDFVVIQEVKQRNVDEVATESVYPNPDQPRTSFNQEEIEELAASIENEGLLQPIVVRSVGKKYQIIAGERRWHACKLAGLSKIPVRIREADDDKAVELALVENIQRSDLNPIEEAYGYKRLMERKSFTQSEIAQLVSKGRSTIANALRLLELPEQAQQLLFENKITSGHARAILSIPTKEGRQKLTDRMVEEKISVREAEAIARLLSSAHLKHMNKNTAERTALPPSYKAITKALQGALQTKVRVKSAGGKNKIEIEFKDEEELKRIYEVISPEADEI
jgi:ParB family chromosome partitioning protein